MLFELYLLKEVKKKEELTSVSFQVQIRLDLINSIDVDSSET